MAVEELDSLCNRGQHHGDDILFFRSNPVLQLAFYLRAQAYSAMGNYQGSIDAANWILDHRLYTSFENLLDFKLLKAKACRKSGDIETAAQICFDVVEAFDGRQVAAYIITDCYTIHAQCWYEVGNWDFCIRASQTASWTERDHSGVHRLSALGNKAEGQTARAVVIMSEAVLYEVDVAQGDMEANIRLLKQLQASLEAEKKTGIDLSYKGPEPSLRCGICKANTEVDVELGWCKHNFCFECIRDWWIEYIQETSKSGNQDAYYKGQDASCPVCRNGK